MKKIAVVLSGCGYLDGSEVTEAVSLIIEVDKLGCSYDFYAPNLNYTPAPHLNKALLNSEQSRNSLEESARIARGKINDLGELKSEKYDGLAFPGGFGAAKNLSSWAKEGAACSVIEDVSRSILAFHAESKPIMAICIAPVLVAKVLGKDFSPSLTLGIDENNSVEIEKTGSEHVNCIVTDFVTDRENKIISTPAYMMDASPHEVFTGISRASAEFVEMC